MEWPKEAHPELILFQQDNVRPHVTRVIPSFLYYQGIKVMHCIPYSPHFNSIANLWKNLVNRFPRRWGNQKDKQWWSWPCKTSKTWFNRSLLALSVEYAHKKPGPCPGPGRSHLLSRTLSNHLFDHLLWFPIVYCPLDIGDPTKFSGVTLVSAPVWFVNSMLPEFWRNCWFVALKVLSKPYSNISFRFLAPCNFR